MKTITIVYDPERCYEDAELDDEEYDLFGQVRRYLNEAGVSAQINQYEGDVRPVNDPSVLISIEDGTFQGAIANLPITVEVFDVDDLKTEGKDAVERQAIWTQHSAGLTIHVAR